jgi:hypothetical protein
MRLQYLKRQWVAFENAYNTVQSNNGYYYYPSFEDKNLILQGQVLHEIVYPTSNSNYATCNWVLPSPS